VNRRDFLKILLASASASAYDWEKLLWIPKPQIVVPPRDIWQASSQSGVFRAVLDGGRFNLWENDILFYNEKLDLYKHYGMLFKKIGDPINKSDQAFYLSPKQI